MSRASHSHLRIDDLPAARTKFLGPVKSQTPYVFATLMADSGVSQDFYIACREWPTWLDAYEGAEGHSPG